MKLTFTQPEIDAILRAHIAENVKLVSGTDYAIEYTSTRSDDGVTATVNIPYMGVTSLPGVIATKTGASAPETTQAAAESAAAVSTTSEADQAALARMDAKAAAASTSPAEKPTPAPRQRLRTTGASTTAPAPTPATVAVENATQVADGAAKVDDDAPPFAGATDEPVLPDDDAQDTGAEAAEELTGDERAEIEAHTDPVEAKAEEQAVEEAAAASQPARRSLFSKP